MILQSTKHLQGIPGSIVSLVPSQTELLHYLELNESIAGITKFCVYPPDWSKTKIIVGGTKDIKQDGIEKINPGLIIANKEENDQQQVEALAKKYNVWLTDISNLQDALQMINDIGELTGTSAKATDLIKQIETAFSLIPHPGKKIKTGYLIWRKPYITIGGDTFIHAMMEKCGFENSYANEKRYPKTSIENLQASGCELLLLSSEPFPFKQKHIDELQPYLPNTKIMLADGEMFSWYGSRLLLAPGYFTQLILEVNKIQL